MTCRSTRSNLRQRSRPAPLLERLPELGRVVQLVPLTRSWWLSTGRVESRANGVAPNPGPSGSPSARGARMSASGALAAHVRHQRVRHAPACRPLASRPKLVSQKGNATWLSLLVLLVVAARDLLDYQVLSTVETLT